MTATWVEVLSGLWLLISLAGLAVNLYTLKDGKKDRYVAQHHIHKGTRLHVANTNIRRERVRATVQLLFLAAALVSMNNPPDADLVPARVFIALVLTLASIAQAGNSMIDAKDRQELLRLIDLQQGQTEHQIRNKLFREQAEAAIAARENDPHD